MYDLVLLKYRNRYLASVFDKRNNEIWNSESYSDLLLQELKKQNFTIDFVIFEDNSLFCLDLLISSGVIKKNTTTRNVLEIVAEDNPIANENMGIYGQARYIHRMSLKKEVQ